MGSAKADRIKRLLYVLEHASGWVSSSVLTKMVGISARSLRNYVAEVNSTGEQHIESSNEGYRLAPAPEPEPEPGPRSRATQPTTAEERRNYVLARLVNAPDELSVFDVADELFISESTLSSSVMPQVRQLLTQFDLACETHDFRMRLTGREQDKRKLLGHIATHNVYGYFSSTKTLEQMFPGFDIQSILAELVQICQRSELFINDYALNNLLVHLLVIIVRLTANNELSERDDLIDAESLIAEFAQRDGILRCAEDIARYFEREYGCTIPETDSQQIILLIALSVERVSFDELNFENLARLIDQQFLDTVQGIAADTTARYGITPFDEPLLLQLTLHMYNAYQRAIYHVGYPNPLAAQIKQEHAPVYDMAVYFAHRFSLAYDVEIGENEIAFIAFHIGAYLERIAAPANKATCIVIVEEYHDFARQLVDDIRRALGDDVSILGVMSCDGYLASHPESDLVITTIDVPVTHGEKALIGPILTKQNLRKIRDKLSDVLEEKRMRRARQFLKQLLSPTLFARNVRLEGGPDAYIDYLGGLCVAAGLADRSYVDDVHLRERVSSTAFTDCLALPHAISSYPARSFIAVLHNDAAIPWGRHAVHFVLLIGIAEEEMGLFRDTLDLIIDLFSSMDKTMRLMQTDTFDEFLAAFLREIS